MIINNDKKRKYIFIIVFLTLIIIFLVFAYIFEISKIRNYKVNIQNYEQQIKKLKLNENELLEEVQSLKYGKNELCTFIQTYQIIDIMDYYYKIDPNYTFVVVDQYQDFNPSILRIPNNIIENIEINSFYEITFMGYKNERIDDLEIKKIEKTAKRGLEQIQDTCK